MGAAYANASKETQLGKEFVAVIEQSKTRTVEGRLISKMYGILNSTLGPKKRNERLANGLIKAWGESKGAGLIAYLSAYLDMTRKIKLSNWIFDYIEREGRYLAEVNLHGQYGPDNIYGSPADVEDPVCLMVSLKGHPLENNLQNSLSMPSEVVVIDLIYPRQSASGSKIITFDPSSDINSADKHADAEVLFGLIGTTGNSRVKR
jgi:hypothetical protein